MNNEKSTAHQGDAMRKTTQMKSIHQTATDLHPEDRGEPVKPNHLQVTACQIFPLQEPLGKTRAMARVVLADQIQFTGIRVVDGANGLFVAYPNDPSYKGDDYRSLYYPITRELRDHVEQVILDQYNEAVKG